MSIPNLNRQPENPYAIVIGLDSIQGLQTARVLAQRGVPVIGIVKDPDHAYGRTRACRHVLVADTNTEACIEVLRSIGPALKHKAVIYPCGDMNVLLVSRHRDQLRAWYHVILPDAELVEVLLEKNSFYAYAQQQGWPVPQTYVLETRADAEAAAAELSFPSMLKPALKTPEWQQHVGRKVIRVADPEELLAVYDQYARWTDGFIVQEWIDGTDADLYDCNCYCTARGEQVATFMSRKLRQWPPEMGIGCLREECRNDDVLAASVDFFNKISFRGLGYIEFKRDTHTGKYVLIEVNVGRPTGGSAIAEAGGVELHYAMYCDALGWPLPKNLEQRYTGVKWIHLQSDLKSALHYYRRGELSPAGWWRSLKGRKTYAVLSWTDPLPTVSGFMSAVRGWQMPNRIRTLGRRMPALSSTVQRGE